MRKQVEALLAAHEEAGSFIEKPAFEVEAQFMADNQNELAIGQTIGHYKVISTLGVGGMSEVYLAEDTHLGRKIALKLLPAFTQDLDRARRFQQEARAASALNHPNIITIYEIGKAEERHFIATEFIDGETLRMHISGSQSRIASDGKGSAAAAIQLSEALNIAMQVADALAAAHAKGIVHRDIKPENIMLVQEGQLLRGESLVNIHRSGVEVARTAQTKTQVRTLPTNPLSLRTKDDLI